MIVLYNPHVDDFLAEPPHFRFLKRRPLKKYGFIIEQEMEHGGKLHVLIDGTISAFFPERYFSKLPRFVRKWVAHIESSWWIKINGLDGKVEYVKGVADNSVLLMFSYKGATGLFPERIKAISAFPAIIAHLSHYFVSTLEKSNNLSTLPNVWLAGDSDISSNSYFRKFFDWYQKPFLVVPFSVAPRFALKTPLPKREQKCVATGSFHNLDEEKPRQKYRDFQSFFRTNTYHPIRKKIHENTSSERDDIVSYVSFYRSNSGGNNFSRLIKHFRVNQKAYFSIDIVDLYNSYQFAVVGEEITGFPALGSIEAMACGTVLIGDPRAYEGLGLIPGVHYVAHDGTVEGIKSAMHAICSEQDKATMISEAGRLFVEKHFRALPAYKRLVAIINETIHASITEN